MPMKNIKRLSYQTDRRFRYVRVTVFYRGASPISASRQTIPSGRLVRMR